MIRKLTIISFCLALLASIVLVNTALALPDASSPFPLQRPVRPTSFPLARPERPARPNPMIATGIFTTVGLRNNGTVVCTVKNGDMCQFDDVVSVSQTDDGIALLRSDGTAYVSGDLFAYSDAHEWSEIVQVLASAGKAFGLKSDGTVVSAGYDQCGETNVSAWTDIVSIDCSGAHTVGLKSDGTVVAVGMNDNGECNVSGWSNIVQIAAGCWLTVGLKSNGDVVATGRHDFGQNNLSDWHNVVAVYTNGDFVMGLRQDGTVLAKGQNNDNVCNVSGWKDIVAISLGYTHAVGLKSDGTVVASGEKDFGECNVSGWTNIISVSAKQMHTVGLKSDGTVVAAGMFAEGYDQDVSGWRLGKSGETLPHVPMETIQIKGPPSVTPETYDILYTVETAPEDASVSYVKWSIVNSWEPGQQLASMQIHNGAAVLDTYSKTGSFTIRAEATDGSGVYAEKTINIVPKAENFSYFVNDDGTATIDGYTGDPNATSIVIPDKVAGLTVTSVYGFRDFPNLASITLPSGLKTIDGGAFMGSFKLAQLIIPTSNGYFTSENGVLFSKDKSELIIYPAGKPGSTYSIPSSVKTIKGFAFNYNTQLTSLTIPDTVTTIEPSAFFTCQKLASVTLGSGLKTLDKEVFWQNEKLATVRLGSGIDTIRSTAFVSCYSLKSISIPNNVRTVETHVFADCQALETVTIEGPDTDNISPTAFEDTASLKQFIANPGSSTAHYVSQDGVLYERQEDGSLGLFIYPQGKTDAAFTVPSFATSVGETAFNYNLNLVSLAIPDSVKTVSTHMIFDVENLETLSIGNGVSDIGYGFCVAAIKLRQVTFGSGVKTIDPYAFIQCNAIEEITVADGEDATYTSDGYGVLYKDDQTDLVKYPGGKPAATYTVPDTVTAIDQAAFAVSDADVSAKSAKVKKALGSSCGLSRVIVPASVTRIGDEAFANCGGLSSIIFEGNAPELGEKAFDGVDGSFTVYYPTGATGFDAAPWTGMNIHAYAADELLAISVGSDQAKLVLSASMQMTASQVPSGAVLDGVTWSVVNGTGSATVSANGLLSATGVGTVIVRATATADGQVVGEKQITVTRLAAPAGLTATSAAYNGITLTWAPVSGVKQYQVWRCGSLNGTYTLAGTTDIPSFTNTGLLPNTVYYFKIRACGIDLPQLFGDYSTAVSARPLPGAPVSIQAQMSTYNSISISWASVDGAAKYELYRSAAEAGPYKLLATTAYPAYTNKSVDTGKTYYYKARAYCKAGKSKVYGGYSAAASAATSLGTPGAPAAAVVNYFSVKISWQAVPGASQYEIYRSLDGGTTYGYFATTTRLYYTNANLPMDTEYRFKVKAYRLVSGKKVYGGDSDEVSARTALIVVTAPMPVSAVSAAYNSIKVSWTAVPGASKYEVYRAPSADSVFKLIATTASTAYVNKSLATNVQYVYKVRAYRDAGGRRIYGEYSDVASARPVPAAPLKVTATVASATSIKVTWGTVAGRTQYEVWVADTEDGEYQLLATTANTYFYHNSLTAGQTHYYKVRAYRMVNAVPVYGEFSVVVSTTP